MDKEKSFLDNEEILSNTEEALEKLHESIQLLKSMEEFLDDDLTNELEKLDSTIRDPMDITFELEDLEKELVRYQETLSQFLYEEVCLMKYPFSFPTSFFFHQNKYDLDIKLSLIQSFSSLSLKKIFSVEKFFKTLSISNQKRTEMKTRIVNLFEELKKWGMIEPKLELYKDKVLFETTEQLTPLLLSRTSYICFYEILRDS
jgi:hypothetical protein